MSNRYKCIIAEDERRMAELVRLLGHWDENDIEIIDICYNGIDALDSIIKNKPDIVITDIKMPGFDGLALIEKCQSKNIVCAFIIVSGYKHFEYAKSAMQYGVVDYILKPIDEIQLNEAIKKSIEIIRSRKSISLIKSERDEYFDKYNAIKYSELWNHLFINTLSNHTSNIDDYFGILPKSFEANAYRIIYIQTSIDNLLDQNSLFRDKLGIILKGVESKDLNLIYHYGKDGVFILLNYEQNFTININQIISSIYYSLRSLTEIFDDFDLDFGFSTQSPNLKDLSKLMKEAITAESAKFIYGANKIISYEMVQNSSRFSPQDILTNSILDELREAYEFVKVNSIYDLHQKVLVQCEKYHNYNPWDMIMFQQYLLGETLSLFIKNLDNIEQQKIDIWWSSTQSYSFVEFIRLTFKSIESHFENYLLEQKQVHILPTEKALKFIESHYSEPITLEEISEHIGLSLNYFSKIFKNEMGKGYAEYLAEYRIEKSKKLLVETTKSVKEISICIGYPDQKYFSKLFRKVTGIKPSEYRKLYS